MSSSNHPEHDDDMLDPNEAEEEIQDDGDVAMDSDDDEEANIEPGETLEEIALVNDSAAHFDAHSDSIFCIAQHPIHASIVATGGGDDLGYVWDATPQAVEKPVLPASYRSTPQPDPQERESLKSLYKLEGHTDSVNAITWTLPKAQYITTAGLDGKLRAWATDKSGTKYKYIAEAKEVEEINWLLPCPNTDYPNTVALGASDGSVWLYTVNIADKPPLTIVQSYFLHTGACTAGAWSPDGKLLATVSEDSSLYVWDVFGEAAAAGIETSSGSGAVVGLTASDERFKVDGGLYSVAISPNGALVAVGGAEGHIRVIGLPRLGAESSTAGASGSGAGSKTGGGKQAGGPGGSAGQAGQILASLQSQSDGVETLSFSSLPLTLLAAGSVDGSIVLFDYAHRFAVRRNIQDAHGEEDEDESVKAVVKVEFVKSKEGQGTHMLTSCGVDGIVKRWDVRGGTAAANKGLVSEWRGHRGGGEGGGVLGFVQGGANIVTAGDDGVALVFPIATA